MKLQASKVAEGFRGVGHSAIQKRGVLAEMAPTQNSAGVRGRRRVS